MSTAETAAQEDKPMTDDEFAAAWAEELASRQAPSGKEAATDDEPQVTEATETTTQESAAAETAAKAGSTAAEDPRDKRLAALEQLLTKIQTEQGRTNGRVAAIQSTLATGKAAAKATPGGPSDAQIEAAIEDPAEWKQLMEDFPDWGVAFEKKMDAKIASAMKARPAEAAAPVQPAAGAADPNADLESRVQAELMKREVARVDRKHPAWRETVKTPEFQDWKAKQSAEIQALYTSGDGDDAIEMLSLFEGSKTNARTQAITSRRKGNLEVAAVTGKPRQQAAAAKVADQDLTPAQIWEQEKRKREQSRQRAA